MLRWGIVELSERIRSVLVKLVEELKLQESISGIGLFGSWSRSDAVRHSDVDLLIIDKRDFDHQYVERVEFDNLLLDLNYIPEKWIMGRVPPQIDQKIYEVNILHDPDEKLARTKSWMSKTFWAHERVDVRTESYLMDAYSHLSRASSAQSKGDFRSACVYASTGPEEILKTLIEVNMLPVSNSHFIEALESSARELGMQELFESYLDLSRLSELDQSKMEDGLSHLETAWNDVISSIQGLDAVLEKLHVRVRRNLNYYGKPAFLKGLIARSKAMMEKDAFVEAGHYTNRTFLDMLENFAWLALATKGLRFDYTTLFDSLVRVGSSRTILETAVRTFGLDDVSAEEVEASLKRAKEMVNDIRQMRRDLITRYVKSPA